jgi:hypothetical protein
MGSQFAHQTVTGKRPFPTVQDSLLDWIESDRCSDARRWPPKAKWLSTVHSFFGLRSYFFLLSLEIPPLTQNVFLRTQEERRRHSARKLPGGWLQPWCVENVFSANSQNAVEIKITTGSLLQWCAVNATIRLSKCRLLQHHNIERKQRHNNSSAVLYNYQSISLSLTHTHTH